MARLVVVSNRVPAPNGAAQAGGLAVVLEALVSERGGLWFGWSGNVAADAVSRPVSVSSSGAVIHARLDLTPAEHEGYYNGFANGVLWPLFHTMPELMSYERHDAVTYREVNARFADGLMPLLRSDDMLWVHDYHLMALPAQLRSRGVGNLIGFFLHIPFPAAEVMALAPAAARLIKDLLAADLIGFQTAQDMNNFAAAAERLAGAVPLPGDALALRGRVIRLGVFPAEIDPAKFAAIAAASAAEPPAQRLLASLGEQKLMLGVDRLDPTKGLLQRLHGLRRLFERHPEWLRHTTLLQIAALSRQDVTTYRDLKAAVDRVAGSLNADLGDADWQPLRLLAKAGKRDVIAGYMRLARIGLVTPLRDGMNLVAKEYIAAQDPDNPGVLVLSRFAGAAEQLDAALLVNPHDPDDIAEALHRGLAMGLDERRARWQALWQVLASTSSIGWGRAFLVALGRCTEAHRPMRAASVGLPLRAQSAAALPALQPLLGTPGPRLDAEHPIHHH